MGIDKEYLVGEGKEKKTPNEPKLKQVQNSTPQKQGI